MSQRAKCEPGSGFHVLIATRTSIKGLVDDSEAGKQNGAGGCRDPELASFAFQVSSRPLALAIWNLRHKNLSFLAGMRRSISGRKLGTGGEIWTTTAVDSRCKHTAVPH